MNPRDFMFFTGAMTLETGWTLMKPGRLLAAAQKADYTIRIESAGGLDTRNDSR